jgi:hypothetical protein
VIFTNGPGARLRASPGTSSQVVDLLRDGTRVTRLGPTTPRDGFIWHQVRAPGGQEGWVVAGALSEPTP